MQLRDKIFDNYYSVHGKYLEGAEDIKEKWFNNLSETNYAKHMPFKEGKILEIGCNKGYILKWMRSKGYSNIEGVDLSPEDVEMAKKYVGIDSIYCADASEYLLTKEGLYDYILGKDILEHIEKNKLDGFLNLVHKSLRPGGKAIFQVPNMDWIMAQHERYMDLTHEIGFTRESLGALLRLYFDQVDIRAVIYEFPRSFKSNLIIKVFKPIVVRLTRKFLKLLGEGSGDCWFEYREILGIGKKK